MLVGESPGHEEDEAIPPRPFVGITGRELDRFYLRLAALERREIFITNLVQCHPYGNRNPTSEEIKYFEPFLLAEIEEVNPQYIVPLGSFAVRYFLGGNADLHQVHGLPHVRSKWPGRIILPCYHPAAGLHNIENQPLITYDFSQIKLAMEGTLPAREQDKFKNPVYTELTTAKEVYQSLDGCISLIMGQDTEGYTGHSWGLSYSVDEGIAYVIRAGSKEALGAFNDWLQRHPEVITVLHNALHDLPILREMGVNIGKFEDTMVYAYCLSIEPQGLKDLAYRHCGMHMKSYDDVIGPPMRKLTSEYLIKVAQGDWGLDPQVPERDSDETIKYRQPQALHKRAVRAVNDILGLYTGTILGNKRGGAAKLKEIGIHVGKVDHSELNLPKTINAWHCEVPVPVKDRLEALYGEYIFNLLPPVAPEDPPDPIKRWEGMSEDLEESVLRCENAIGSLPITGLDAIEDQQIAVNYSARDAHATIGIRNKLRNKVEANGMLKLAELDMSVLPFLDRMRTAGIRVNKPHMLDYGAKLGLEMRELQAKLKENLGIWVNPSSSKQVGMIIYDILGFPVTLRTETGQPSTNDKILEALSPLNPNIALITDFRELHKLRSTYALKLPRWMDEYGRLHATWKYTRVASGRLATADPNLLGIPTRSTRGKMIRAGFVPEPGHVFLSCDLSQIEVRVAAHFSQDPNLMQIFMTKGADFHSKTTAFMWKISEEEVKADDELNGGSSKRSSAKNVSFGVLYGISARGLQAQLKSKCHTDWSEEQCQEMIDLWLETAYPRVKWYMERQKHMARRDGFVQSMFGRRRYVPGVNSSVHRIREEAYRQAINHPIQSTAAEMLKIAEANIWNKVLPSFWARGCYVEPIAAVHDELIFEVNFDVAKELQDAVIYEMENAVQLCIPVVSKGKLSKLGEDGGSWADLK